MSFFGYPETDKKGEKIKVLNEKLKKDVAVLTEKKNKIQQHLSQMPEGELICTQNGKYTKWYQSNHELPLYLPKKKRELAEKLAWKKYCILQMQEMEEQIKVLNQCITSIEQINRKSEKLLKDGSPYQELLKRYFEIEKSEAVLWEKESYKSNAAYPENLIYKTMKGHMVRSKSEILIANALYLNKIPYRYECQLMINGISIYPDFTIFNQDPEKIFYWEHFGMMENELYRENAYNKLKLYGQSGIIPSVNLITTFETKSHPLDSEKIQKIINENFQLNNEKN